MNKPAIIFEISSIMLLLALSAGLSAIAIDGTGLIVVAGLLGLFFIASYHKLLRVTLAQAPWAPSASKTRS
jgi:hypothetical protein